MRNGRALPWAGTVVGAVLGVGVEAGGALLLYTGRGLLAATGVLLALALGALAAGLWAGSSGAGGDPSAASTRWRWAGAVAALIAAAVFAGVWLDADALRQAPAGRAVAVALFLAWPAYALGALLAALTERSTGVPVAALVGAAVGVLAASLVLIPNIDPAPLLFAAAAVLAFAGIAEARSDRSHVPARRGRAMDGEVAIITGVGGRGQVGYALAEAFRDAGARLVVTDVAGAVEDLAGELAERGEVVGVTADLSDEDAAERVADTARGRYGRLDTLVNVAGGLTAVGPVAETAPDAWRGEIERNASTAFLMSRAALPLLREDGGGAIVNFASPAGLRASAGLGAYSAGKAAVVALTRTLALEEKRRGVRVNAVAPGMIDTEQNRRMVEDAAGVDWVARAEVAGAVIFLASDAAAAISGETIQVLGDGME